MSRIALVKSCNNYPIDPGDSTYNRTWPPLSLLNCAAMLREEGHDVMVIDGSARQLEPAEIARQAAGCDSVFITSASLDRWQCPNLNLDPFVKTVFAVKKEVDTV